MKRIRLFAALFCCVAILALPVTPALPVGAADSEALTWNNFVYSVTTTPAGHSYVTIIGYLGEESEITVPGEIKGLSVEYIHNLYNADGSCPRRLVIPEGVKAIRALFGEHSTALQEVVLPSTLKVMGGSERPGYWLEEGTQYVSTGVFADASSLKTLKVPYSVALMSENTFHEGITLQVEAGSYAARWAKANEQPFEIIEHAPSVGDYDADGLTTSTDARLLLQQVAGKVTFVEAQSAVADVDGDGEVTTTDARLTLQHAVGKESVDTLTCPLTFDSPLIPRGAATEIKGSVIVSCSMQKDDGSDRLPPGYNYRRAPGPFVNASRAVDYLNACVDVEYASQPSYAIVYSGAGLSMYVDGVPLRYQQNHALFYYDMMFTVQTGSQLVTLILE